MSLKNKKYYAVASEKYGDAYRVSNDINESKKGLNEEFPLLVELTVTKVYTRETDLKEIEL